MENSSAVSRLSLPAPYVEADVQRCLHRWDELAKQQQDKSFGAWMQQAAMQGHPTQKLLQSVFGNSSYLSRLLLLHPRILYDFLTLGSNQTHAQIMQELSADAPDEY